jgi:hypothetical protein
LKRREFFLLFIFLTLMYVGNLFAATEKYYFNYNFNKGSFESWEYVYAQTNKAWLGTPKLSNEIFDGPSGYAPYFEHNFEQGNSWGLFVMYHWNAKEIKPTSTIAASFYCETETLQKMGKLEVRVLVDGGTRYDKVLVDSFPCNRWHRYRLSFKDISSELIGKKIDKIFFALYEKSDVPSSGSYKFYFDTYQVAEIGDLIPPLAPAFPEIMRTERGKAELKWLTPREATDGDLPVQYNIYVGDQEDFLCTYETFLTKVGGNRTSFIAEGLSDAKYFFKITSLDEHFNESEPISLSISAVGHLRGKVLEQETGNAISDALVEVVGGTSFTTTDVNGNFFLPNVDIGTNIIRCKKAGFITVTSDELIVAEGETLALDFSLLPRINPPQNPTNLQGQATSPGIVELTWVEPEDVNKDGNVAAYYKIYRSTSKGGLVSSSNLVATNISKNTWKDVSVLSETYYYAVTAVNDAELESGRSNILTIEAIAAPIPEILRPFNEEIFTDVPPLISWKEIANVATYQVEIADNPEFKNKSVHEGSGLTMQLSESLPEGKYYVRMRAIYKSEAISQFSESRMFVSVDSMVKEKNEYTISYFSITPKGLQVGTNTISINYTIKAPGKVTIQIFDDKGKLVTNLVSKEQKEAGAYSVQWNGDVYRSLPIGIYYTKITCDFGERTAIALRKFLLYQ